MAIKIITENSNISVKTFAKAPESADLEIQLLDGTVVKADTMLEVTSVDSLFSSLGLPKDSITNEQFVALAEKVISQGSDANEQSLLQWANNSAIFATLAGSEPLTLLVSGLVGAASLGSKGIEKLKSLVHLKNT
ncbi:hypothetical protein ACLIN6_003626 [Vibrio cholerae]|uniref:hypothetical protein n=1 Tax=Vibrio TaxID=662 RepID=UPI0009B700BB|nr:MULTISPECIES: hypothetical protein [Vibrio]OQK34489.1 hypothetical protein XM74_u0074 [Vibrio vulnificus]POC21342.1 hypothetical protein CRN46_14915 [Vibrio vulnificus]RBM24533.1 hypothetical protein DLR59_19055 [Vibrio tarriae]TXX82253.1 hypothetical protein FXE94_17155 [Vibrio cholerae]GHY56675.1 hypothetical protein VCSRO119_3762 [Vibrio cholerae]